MTNSDDPNKTVFLNPGDNVNQTVLMPNPGRRLGANPEQRPPGAAAPVIRPDTASSAQRNSILSAATALIAVLTGLRTSTAAPKTAQLQQELIAEIRNFDAQLQRENVRQEAAISARYILCSALDEAVLNTPWGAESGWAQRSLLHLFHNETSGGEKFFALLERISQRQSEFRDLLELFYICLTLGFQGRYQLDSRGKEKLDAIREQLFRALYADQRSDRLLSPHWQPDNAGGQRLVQFVPLWVVAAVALTIIVLAYTSSRLWLHATTAPVVESFEQIFPASEPR